MLTSEELNLKFSIDIPRYRGFGYTKDLEEYSLIDVKDILKSEETNILESLCRSNPKWSINSFSETYSYSSDMYFARHLKRDGKLMVVDWDKIHGKKRKALKYEIKTFKRNLVKMVKIWNQYAKKDGFICIRARIGGDNWNYFKGDKLKNYEWFVDKVDDAFDSTYCYIFAKI